jgi:hypothetical protein
MAATGAGKDRRGDYQGTFADASLVQLPGLGGCAGMTGTAAERRQATAAECPRPVGTAVPGVQRAPGPVRVSFVRNVETLLWVRISGAGMRRRCGRPTVRGAEFLWRDRVSRKRMPGGRKAAGKRGRRVGDSSRMASYNWPGCRVFAARARKSADVDR